MSESKKKYKIATLGCRTNQYESAAYRTQLEALGFEEAKEGEEADTCIINTCTVTAGADRDGRRILRKLIRENPQASVAVTGCMVDAHPKLQEEIEGITFVIPNRNKEQLIASFFPYAEELPEFKIDHFQAHTRAFVKVQDGCNSYCTYCIIPYVRGRSRSRKIEEIVHEIEGLLENGYKEIVLTGINIGDFEESLATLVRKVDALEGLVRLRISSIDPDEVDDDLLDAVVNGVHTCPSMHIVLQAGSNPILKRMNRKYTKQDFYQTVERLKAARPDFTFTTDIIVGFPGETERDFEETLAVVQEVEFAKVHMFPYSPRERTKAALYPNRVSHEVVAERKSRLMRLAEHTSYKLRERYVGQEMSVLIEEGNRGHTPNFLPVEIQGSQWKSNEIVQVRLTHNQSMGLVGEVLCAL
ncbi:MAG: tRNA (N(6)-L-threonylcarbamoyladenosine(37)-C(2))-methylthiotransferase MtaB [Verrucomicrobia bacterium]|nr:tRNA (N(6)-L-threonylcarbamoyladenosine(37)-C(2))-methylthiotransferase MtaB [Verrucomicrobiota bacterium]